MTNQRHRRNRRADIIRTETALTSALTPAPTSVDGAVPVPITAAGGASGAVHEHYIRAVNAALQGGSDHVAHELAAAYPTEPATWDNAA